MRSLLFISPHFPPDSAAGTHRARILAPHLAGHGWRPIVLTVDPASIDGELDEELGDAVNGDLRVVRVRAWPHRWTRRAGFGDLGLRAYRSLRRAAMDLARTERVHATLVTTYPTYPALIGAAMKRTLRIPFVLDLQDPWVGAWGKEVGPGGRPDLRSRASRALATRLEVRAVEAADALMSVTRRTIAEVISRVPSAASLPQLDVPIGWDAGDWSRVRDDGRPNGLFDRNDGRVHVCAVGTVLPTATDGLRALLGAVSCLVRDAAMRDRLRVWFVGTSNQRRADAPALVRPLAEAAGVGDVIIEQAPRLAYFDALRVLRDAHAVLVLGSHEPHYTPSRVFPAIASRHPVIARLRRDSPASQLLAEAAATRHVELIDATRSAAEQTQAFGAALTRVLHGVHPGDAADDGPIAPYTGESLARGVAALLDRVTAA
jgi:hypothetical protein